MVFSINPTPEKTQAMFKELAIAQNGEGGEAPIVGGPPAEEPPAEEPPADAPPADAPPADAPPADDPPADAPPAEDGVVPGEGVVGEDGSCVCVVSCVASGFPALEAQGINAWGGQAGSIPKIGSIS